MHAVRPTDALSVPNIPSGVRWGVYKGIAGGDDDGKGRGMKRPAMQLGAVRAFGRQTLSQRAARFANYVYAVPRVWR